MKIIKDEIKIVTKVDLHLQLETEDEVVALRNILNYAQREIYLIKGNNDAFIKRISTEESIIKQLIGLI